MKGEEPPMCIACDERLNVEHNERKCTNIVSVQISFRNLPVHPSFPVEFSTLSGKKK